MPLCHSIAQRPNVPPRILTSPSARQFKTHDVKSREPLRRISSKSSRHESTDNVENLGRTTLLNYRLPGTYVKINSIRKKCDLIK